MTTLRAMGLVTTIPASVLRGRSRRTTGITSRELITNLLPTEITRFFGGVRSPIFRVWECLPILEKHRSTRSYTSIRVLRWDTRRFYVLAWSTISAGASVVTALAMLETTMNIGFYTEG